MAERGSLLTQPVQLLTVIETAKRLQCSPNHVYRLIAAGKLRSLDVALPGSQRAKTRVSEVDLAAYIEASTDA
jgi:excisionase family DNA binding protein